jgi:hypothetical protein
VELIFGVLAHGNVLTTSATVRDGGQGDKVPPIFSAIAVLIHMLVRDEYSGHRPFPMRFVLCTAV